jgi:hypothetical protein
VVGEASRVSPDCVAIMLLLSSMKMIHLRIVCLTPCWLTALTIVPYEVLSNDPLYQRKHLRFVFDFIVNLGYEMVKVNRFRCRGKFLSISSFCLSTNFYIKFNKNYDRLIGCYDSLSII